MKNSVKRTIWLTAIWLVLVLMVAVLALLAGCASTRVILLREEESIRLPIRAIDAPEIAAGTVLFVNRTPGVWRSCVVYPGWWSIDQLIVGGLDGNYHLRIEPNFRPKGYFEVDPAMGGPRHSFYKEQLVGLFDRGAAYTIVVITKSFTGGVLQIDAFGFQMSDRYGERYYYYPTLGPVAALDRQVSRPVNHVEHLPDFHPDRVSNDFHLLIILDLDRLLHGAPEQIYP
ncbi:MAG: hypothetical protein AAB642_02500 [Patescibacteria group bacterium]